VLSGIPALIQAGLAVRKYTGAVRIGCRNASLFHIIQTELKVSQRQVEIVFSGKAGFVHYGSVYTRHAGQLTNELSMGVPFKYQLHIAAFAVKPDYAGPCRIFLQPGAILSDYQRIDGTSLVSPWTFSRNVREQGLHHPADLFVGRMPGLPARQ